MKYTSEIIITFLISIMITGFVGIQNLNSTLLLIGSSEEITAYIDKSAGEVEKHFAFENIKSMDLVEEVKLVSEKESFAELSAVQGAKSVLSSNFLSELNLENYLSASLRIKLKHNSLDEISNIVGQISNTVGIEEVSFGQEWILTLSKVLQISRLIFLVLGLFFGSIILYLIYLIVQNQVRQKSNEIEILELIGATQKFIFRPFLFINLKSSFLLSGIAILISYLIFESLKGIGAYYFKNSLVLENLEFMSLKSIMILIVANAIFFFSTTYLALKNRGI